MSGDAGGREVGRVSVRVLPNTKDFGKDTKDGVEREVRNYKPEIKVTVDQKTVKDSAREALRELKETLDQVTVSVNADLSRAAKAATQAQLAALTRTRTVNIAPKVDAKGLATAATALATLAGTRGSVSVVKNIAESLLSMDEAVPGILTATSAIIALAATLGTAVGGVFAFGQGLAQISALALVLPGTLGGVAIGVGTFAAAMTDFNTVIPQALEGLQAIQNRISANFWAQAREPIADMVDNLLPKLSLGTRDAAIAMGEWTATFASALSSVLGPALAGMFENLQASIVAFGPAAGALAGIITSFGTLGAQILPMFATWLADILTQFDTWLGRAVETGQAMAWVQTATTNLQLLSSGLASIASIMASISRAATEAGFGGMQAFASGLRAAADAAASPAFQSGLTTALAGLKRAFDAIVAGSGPQLSTLIGDLAQTLGSPAFHLAGIAIGEALGAIAGALSGLVSSGAANDFLIAIAAALTSLTPAITALGPALSALVGTLANFIDGFGPGLAIPITALGGALATLLPALNPIIDALSGAFLQAFVALAPSIAQIATILADVLGIALAAMLPIIEMIAPLVGILGEAFVAILGAVLPLIEPLLKLISAILTPLVAILGPIIQAIVAALVPAIDGLVSALLPIIDVVTTIVEALMAILVPVIEFVVGVLLDMATGFIGGIEKVAVGVGEVITGLKAIFDGLVQFLQGFFQILTGDFDAGWANIKQGTVTVFNGLLVFLLGIWDIISGAIQAAINWIGGVAIKGGLRAIKSFWDDIWGSISAATSSILSTLRGNFDHFLIGLRNAPHAALELLKATFRSSWNSIKRTAANLFRQIVQAISSRFFKAVGAVKKVLHGIDDAITGFVRTATRLGSDIVGGIIAGVTGAGAALYSTLKDLATNALDSAKQALGIRSPSRKFAEVGRFSMQGLLRGLESQYDTVQRSLRGFADDLQTDFAGQDIVAGFSATVSGQLATANPAPTGNTFNYYAAEGSSLGAEEDLFRALGRGRGLGFA